MKQPNFKRKALCMLIAPFALGALPINAVTLDATHYDGYIEFYEATDTDNNRMFFYFSDSESVTLTHLRAHET